MKEIFETLRSMAREDQKTTVEGVFTLAGFGLLEQFLGDVHRIADALERITVQMESVTIKDGVGSGFVRVTQPGLRGRTE